MLKAHRNLILSSNYLFERFLERYIKSLFWTKLRTIKIDENVLQAKIEYLASYVVITCFKDRKFNFVFFSFLI